MKGCKSRKAVLWFTSMFVFLWIVHYSPCATQKIYASQLTEELLQKAFEEEMGSIESFEEIPDDYDNEDLYELTEQYMEMFQNGDYSVETYENALIRNPDIQMQMTDEGKIRYVLPNGEYYESTVPNGMITSDSVRMSPSSQVAAVVTRDGESSHIFNSWNYTEPGNYHIKMLFYNLDSDNYEDIKVYEVSHYFTIVGKKVNHIGVVPAPEGFEIVSVRKDGIQQTTDNPRYVFLEGDGIFEFRYRDQKTNSIYAATCFERDTVAPFLEFSKDITMGPVKGPVEFYKSDINDQVHLYYNGNSSLISNNTLSSPGQYTLMVVDDVGNNRLYNLEIEQSYRIFETKTIILALIFLLGVGVSILLPKRGMKVV